MNREKKKDSMPVVGGSSLLVVFTVLCLTVFALLSLSTAQANANISTAAACATVDYYRADYQAEQILARLRSGEKPEEVTEENGVFRYSCPIDDGQRLKVAVRLDGSRYSVLEWQAEIFGEWNPNTDLPVWNGETE